jgi:citrate lyase subunit beta/citryl-CoA lyase
MFVPGHSAKMVEKAVGTAADAVMFDLEDGVVPALKAAARPIVAAGLAQPARAGGPALYVRVNACDTADLPLDLDAAVVPGLEGLTIPKVETVDQVTALAARLDRLERERGIEPGRVRLMLAIETARALLAAPSLAAASARVSGLMFGAEDFSRDIGLPALRAGVAREFTHARSSIVVAAAAAGVIAVDGVWPDLADMDGLRQDAALARALGFQGKSLVHPSQIADVNTAFSPSDQDILYARALIADFESALADGHGSISFRGKLVDRPIYERAVGTVRLAERLAKQHAA